MEKICGETKALILKQLKSLQNFLELELDVHVNEKVGGILEDLICEIEEWAEY